MKRSEVNRIITEAKVLLQDKGIPLPPFAYWTVDDWRYVGEDCAEIIDNMLGWDVSDFGSGDFEKIGLTVFTFRNGNTNKSDMYSKTYAEKLLLVGDGQKLPFHFHWNKMEDIINRGGGDLMMWLYNSDELGAFAKTDVEIVRDGRISRVKAGAEIVLTPGESITLMPGQYHSWQGVPGTGPVFLFEVSSTNDDFNDNRFAEEMIRLPEFEEDTPPLHLTFLDYRKYVSFNKG